MSAECCGPTGLGLPAAPRSVRRPLPAPTTLARPATIGGVTMRSGTSSSMRVIVGMAVLVASALAPGAVGGAEARGGPAVTVQRIGRPTWKPVDVTVFSATIGTASTGYAEYGTTTSSVLPGPNHAPHPDLGVGPGAPHRPPYRREVSQGVQRAGYDGGSCFTPAAVLERRGGDRRVDGGAPRSAPDWAAHRTS